MIRPARSNSIEPTLRLSTLFIAVCAAAVMSQPLSFDTSFVELDSAKMVNTGETNYAITHPSLPSGWRCASVNFDEVAVVTTDRKLEIKSLSGLKSDQKNALESARNQLLTVVRFGPFNVQSQTGFAKLTTYNRNGGTSTMGSGGSGSSSSSSSSSASGTGSSISRTGKDAYVVSKPDFPFNWMRVFVNGDLTTIVYKDGRVMMSPADLVRPDEREKLEALKREVEKQAKDSENMAKSMLSSLKNPMDFVNKALGGYFG